MLMPRVRGVNSYETDTIVLTGILATRVQMGHVSRKVASTLVADGYAHLVGFVPRSIGLELDIDSKSKITTHEDIAHICYLPDPVCAHLAMCLMDADWKSSDNVKGQSPKFGLMLQGSCSHPVFAIQTKEMLVKLGFLCTYCIAVMIYAKK
jgi:hypothetical protein